MQLSREAKVEKFGEGPWVDEPDRKEWVAHGLPCIVKRNSELGTMCGYVAVPPGHPLHGAGDCDADDRKRALLREMPSHGGVTYAQPCEGDVCHVPAPGEPDNVWWFGWDAGHAFDVQPVLVKIMPDFYNIPVFPKSAYRTFDYAVRTCEEMAAYLAGLHKGT